MGAFITGQRRRQNASPSCSIEISRTSRSIPCISAGVCIGKSSHSSAQIDKLNLVTVDPDLACADALNGVPSSKLGDLFKMGIGLWSLTAI